MKALRAFISLACAFLHLFFFRVGLLDFVYVTVTCFSRFAKQIVL